MQLHIDLNISIYIYILYNWTGRQIHLFQGVFHPFWWSSKTFQQGEYDFQPLLWENTRKTKQLKTPHSFTQVGLKWCVFVSPGDSYWSRGRRQIFRGGPHHWAQAQGILSILGSTTRWRGLRRYSCIGGSSWNAGGLCVFFFPVGVVEMACNIRPRKKMMWNPQNGGLLRFGRWEPFLLNPFALGNWNGFNDASSWNGWKWLDIWKVATIESWIVLYRVHWDCHFGGTLCFLRFSPQLLDRMFWAVDK